jgi:hypothetical protein
VLPLHFPDPRWTLVQKRFKYYRIKFLKVKRDF